MLEKGTVVYFLMNGYVMSGKVFDISGNNDNYEFSIEGYAGCAGPHIISSSEPSNCNLLLSTNAIKLSTL